jgi:hypothetical protein
MGNINQTYLISVLNNKCPRCRQGSIYSSKNAYKYGETVKMNPHCPVCNQPTQLEVGFYYGTGYVSYALSVAFSVATFVAWWVIIGMSLDDNRFFWWMGTNAVLLILMQPLFMRLSRTLWLSWFVPYEKDWKTKGIVETERMIPGQENNW